MDAREIMHERETHETRIAELEAIGREQEWRIAELERALDAKGEQITAIQHQRDSMGETIAELEVEAQRLADELACERERHQATLVVGLGLSDELRVFEDRVERLHLGREDVPRGEQRSGYVAVERKEKR